MIFRFTLSSAELGEISKIPCEDTKSGAKKRVLSLKCLQRKHGIEGLSVKFDPQNLCKNVGVILCI